MNKLPFALLAAFMLVIVGSCSDDGYDMETYAEYQQANIEWYNEQANLKNDDGTDFYTKLSPNWYPSSGVLIHYFNDRELTENNLVPLSTSTVSVKYKGWLYTGAAFDSSYTEVDSIRTFTLNDGLIDGWKVALTNMHVGDSCRVIIPYALGYGVNGSSAIPAFSTLAFDIKLVDIPAYEVRD